MSNSWLSGVYVWIVCLCSAWRAGCALHQYIYGLINCRNTIVMVVMQVVFSQSTITNTKVAPQTH